MAKAIFVGLATIDILYAVDEFPKENAKVAAHRQDLYAGGPATNAAITFSQLGGQATLVTAAGRNLLAGAIRDETSRYGVRLIDLKPESDQPPALSSICVNRAGERSVVSANAAQIPALVAQVDEAVLSGASILLVDGHHMPACRAWSAAARAQGIQTVFDGGSWKEGTDALLKTIDTAICSADFKPPGCRTSDDTIAFLQARGVKEIAITNGPEPIRFFKGSASGNVPVPQVHAVDTMGAGDILHGAFCYYVSNGCAVVEALERAARIASESCRFHGTRQWMQHLL